MAASGLRMFPFTAMPSPNYIPDAVQSMLNNNVKQPAKNISQRKNNIYTNYQILAQR
jgi:hypothetical protein